MIMNIEGFVNQGLREGDLSLRGDNEGSDAAIHRVSEEAGGLLCSVGVDQWIATGFQPSR
jgi:hypothetical protein